MPRWRRKQGLPKLAGPSSAVAEAYRLLRTKLDLSNRSRTLKTVMITSAEPGEGKSTASANLAAAYAQANRNVLLIDSNLRTPSQHRIFELSNRIGLSTALSGRSEIDEVIRPTAIDNLQVICSGPVPSNPSELLASSFMNALLETVSERFDIVIVDTPAIKPVTDGLIMAGKCDGVVLVVRAGKAKFDAAMKAIASLEYGKAPILGAVLNHAR